MTRALPIHRPTVAAATAVLVVVIAGVLLVQARRPDPGTAKWVAGKVEDCHAPDYGPLFNEELSAWRAGAKRSSNFACGDAGPVVQWAHFRSKADLDAAFRAAPGAPKFVCRADRDLVRMIGFARSSELATCRALGGDPA